MEHISEPLKRIVEDVRRKMEERENLKKKALAIKLCKNRRHTRGRVKNPGQFNLF